MNKFEELIKTATKEVNKVATSNQLLDLKSKYLGKNSFYTETLKNINMLSDEEKKEVGIVANKFKNEILKLIDIQTTLIEEKIINDKLDSEKIDVTLRGSYNELGYESVLFKTMREIEDIFIELQYKIEEGYEVENDYYNFELLNLPKNHPARDMQDTFYFDETLLLRTHTSPVQVRTMLKKKGEDIKIICPGKTYRRDNDDATHSHQFAQIEGLVVSKNVTMASLKGTLTHFARKIFTNETSIRFRPSYFPFTEPSVEVDVTCFKCKGSGCSICKHTGWIEILGAGMVHPNVLKMSNYDPNIYSGFAFGMGIDRICMLKYGIDDTRQIYLNDKRFIKQFR